ncbi:hypothetical protein ECC02_008988 [Trypanosoma cruzi]|uniref:Uncharacterized protein n=1 Tax=Trypanosoma cruzi TaxID=5693 RepID=A0A7J6XVT7_TRYCR|nr:hypothetical protein ECC02_008988 [Trypanosoma cruzi]
MLDNTPDPPPATAETGLCNAPALSGFASVSGVETEELLPVLCTCACVSSSLGTPVSATTAVGQKRSQQHRASTNRAHSRRHVIIVSVVVQWCGADLHSEGHGEQQGRREVRQTHTEGTPHEERAAARHAPYAAHHARHTLQSTAAAHTHTVLTQHQHTQKEEGEANRSGTQGSTACTHGEGGPSCRHPSQRVRTHTRGGAAHTATQKQSNN